MCWALGCAGFGCRPWEGVTTETGGPSPSSASQTAFQQSLMRPGCLRRPWTHYIERGQRNSKTLVPLMKILYLLNLHYCWSVAGFLWGSSVHTLINLGWATTRAQRGLLWAQSVWQVQRDLIPSCKWGRETQAALLSVCCYGLTVQCHSCSKAK